MALLLLGILPTVIGVRIHIGKDSKHQLAPTNDNLLALTNGNSGMTCTCEVVGQGTVSISVSCWGQHSSYVFTCPRGEECYEIGSFLLNETYPYNACRSPGVPICGCGADPEAEDSSADTGTNEYKCSDEHIYHCPPDQECYALGSFLMNESMNNICRIASCTCNTPGQGTVDKNGYTCSDGSSAWCQSDQECYALGSFLINESYKACRVPTCTCNTPGQGTVGYNGYKCSDANYVCQSDQECYALGTFLQNESYNGCRVPLCTCNTPGQGTVGYNGYKCTDGSNSVCQSNQECYALGTFLQNESYNGCRVPPIPICRCKTPGKGTVNYNGFNCSDGSSSWCQSSQECYPLGTFLQNESYNGCRVPLCTCNTPGQGAVDYNGFSCSDGSSSWCQSSEECYIWPAQPPFPKDLMTGFGLESYYSNGLTYGCQKPGKNPVCSCVEPMVSKIYTCTLPNTTVTTGSCPESNECFSKSFTGGTGWGCRYITCWCNSPLTCAGSTKSMVSFDGWNQYTCSDGTTGSCGPQSICSAQYTPGPKTDLGSTTYSICQSCP